MSTSRKNRSIPLFALFVLMLCSVAWQPQKTRAAGGGTASWSDSGYASNTTVYSYSVTGAPPNVCGTLHITRNNVPQSPGVGWICTNSSGNATKGPWGPPTSDETATDIYISWPDGSVTSGAEKHINDVTPPTIQSTQRGESGLTPAEYSGTASDAPWGTGFVFGNFGWSHIYATFRNLATNKYYNGSSYSSSTKVIFEGYMTSCCDYHNITWQVTPPPPSVHSSAPIYEWCVTINDVFYTSDPDCIYF